MPSEHTSTSSSSPLITSVTSDIPVAKDQRIRTWPLRLGIFLLFVAATLLAYFPVMNGQFVWDDFSLVKKNQFIRSPVMLVEIFRHPLHLNAASSYYRPIQNVSFLIDYVVWGENPLGFHLTNILIQAACGWLLYQVLRYVLPVLMEEFSGLHAKRVDLVALILALLWVVHPIHNAAVAYISGRADPLSFAFSAAAMCLALVSRRWAGTWKHPALLISAWTIGLLALCTKEIAACWMMLFVFFLCCFDRQCSRRTCAFTIVALLALLGCGWLLRQLPTPIPGAPSPYNPTGPERIILLFRALGDYTRLLVAPVTLTMDRMTWPEWGRVQVTWSNFPMYFGWLGCLGIAVLVLAAAGMLWRGKGQRLRIFGAVWFGLCFLPISNLFPLNAQVAEHWIYLASVGALLFATGLVITLPEKWIRHSVIVVLGVIPVMLLRTNLRAGEWANPIRFYSQTIRATGGTGRTINNLAAAYSDKGDFAQAEQIYRAGLERYPTFYYLLSGLGKLLLKEGRTQEADEWLAKAQHYAKEQTYMVRTGWHAAAASARIKIEEGRFEEAVTLLRSVRAEAPENWELMQKYCEALEKVGGPDAVIPELQEFAIQQWWLKEPRMLLARYWLSRNEPDKALFELRHAARLDVWDPQPSAEIAAIELDRHNSPEALEAQQTAVRRAPKNAKYRAMLALILHELGREGEAVTELQKSKLLEQESAQGKS